MNAAETKETDKRHVVHSWTVNETLDPLVVERAEGVYFWDGDGNKYLDFSSQLVNMNIGHQHPKVTEAIKAGIDTPTAWSMGSLHPATRYAMDGDIGALGHGRRICAPSKGCGRHIG